MALELAWMNNMIDFSFPYLLQVFDYFCIWLLLTRGEFWLRIFFQRCIDCHMEWMITLFPFQIIQEYTTKVDELVKVKLENLQEVKSKEKEEKDLVAQ